jgi:hypothetical protein
LEEVLSLQSILRHGKDEKTDFEYEIAKHERFFYAQLSERQKRLFAALQATQMSYYRVKEVSEIFDIHIHTIRREKADSGSNYERSLSTGGYPLYPGCRTYFGPT